MRRGRGVRAARGWLWAGAVWLAVASITSAVKRLRLPGSAERGRPLGRVEQVRVMCMLVASALVLAVWGANVLIPRGPVQ